MNDHPCQASLLLGGTGLVGRFCLESLLAGPYLEKVILLSRRELPQLSHPRLQQKVVSFENLASTELPPVDDIFCALGTTIRKAASQAAFRHVDFEFPVAAARQALKSGAQQFVLVSSVGADPASKNFYLRTKGEVEQALRSLGFRSLHIFRPSLLLGQRQESRVAETIGTWAARLFQFALVGPLRRYRPIKAQTVGKAMVAAAKSGRPGAFIYEYDEINLLAGAS